MLPVIRAGGVLDRIPGKVRATGGRLRPRATEQLPDHHREALAQASALEAYLTA